MPARSPSRRRQAWLLVAVVALGVAARLTVAAQGWFYWDDLTLHAQARQYPTPHPDLLLQPHDDHLMPGAWLLLWLVAAVAPLNWPVTLGLLGVGQVVAAAAVAWGCWQWCPRWAAVPTGLYLLTPLTLASTTWWATAVNILPLHAALALVVTHTLLAVREPGSRRTHLVVAVAALVVGLLFTERALFIAPVVVLMLWCTGTWRVAAKASGMVSVVVAVPTLAWAGIYLAVVGAPGATGERLGQVPELLVTGYVQALLPTVAGGPWGWERWAPGPPWAAPGAEVVVAGSVAVVLIVWWTGRHRRRDLLVWVPTVVYPLAPLLALGLARTGPETAVEIVQTLRHFSEVAVIAALSLAVLLSRGDQAGPSRTERRVGGVVLVALLISSAVSTVGYARVWAQQPAREYFHTLRAELAQRGSGGEPLLDQPVDLEVLLPVVHPDNMLSRLIGGLPGTPPVEPWTHDPVLIDGQGRVRAAELYPLRATRSDAECTPVAGGERVLVELDGPLLERDWVLRLNYFADAPGTLRLGLDGQPVTVPVDAGLIQVHVALSGGGRQLLVEPSTDTGQVCLARSEVGLLTVE